MHKTLNVNNLREYSPLEIGKNMRISFAGGGGLKLWRGPCYELSLYGFAEGNS